MKQRFIDAYGATLLGCFAGRSEHEILERDDGYIEAGPARTYFREYKQWPAFERRAMKQVIGPRVLDIGCGAGRHLLHLQRAGFGVTGIDNSPLAIRVCRRRGARDARVLTSERIGKFAAKEFDTVVMMGNNLGLFGSFAKARRLLRAMHRITSDRARIVAEALDPYRTKNPVHLAYHRRNRRRGRMGGQIRLRVRFGLLKGKWFDYLFVSQQELIQILDGTGWRLAKTLRSPGATYIAIIEKVAVPGSSLDKAARLR
jgi:SAM-dependent methyltransferase